jgi:hypothetical protein
MRDCSIQLLKTIYANKNTVLRCRFGDRINLIASVSNQGLVRFIRYADKLDADKTQTNLESEAIVAL